MPVARQLPHPAGRARRCRAGAGPAGPGRAGRPAEHGPPRPGDEEPPGPGGPAQLASRARPGPRAAERSPGPERAWPPARARRPARAILIRRDQAASPRCRAGVSAPAIPGPARTPSSRSSHPGGPTPHDLACSRIPSVPLRPSPVSPAPLSPGPGDRGRRRADRRASAPRYRGPGGGRRAPAHRHRPRRVRGPCLAPARR